MSGLVAYESSEEEDETPEVPVAEKKEPTTGVTTGESNGKSGTTANKPTEEATASQAPAELLLEPRPQEPEEPMIGPRMGPEPGAADASYYPPLEEEEEEEEEEEDGAAAPAALLAPGSPYSAARALARELTLPPLPDTAIPPSPPGSPPRAATRKLAQFLALKRQGVHFNAKVAGAPALANPALADKLLAFAGAGAREHQYATALPPDVWDPAALFPRHAFREQLRAAQAEGARERARGRGAAVQFVPPAAAAAGGAAAAASSSSNGSGGSGGGTSTGAGKRKTRFGK